MLPITNAAKPNISTLDIDFDHRGLVNTLVADMAELLETYSSGVGRGRPISACCGGYR
jgi:hypothetical protein